MYIQLYNVYIYIYICTIILFILSIEILLCVCIMYVLYIRILFIYCIKVFANRMADGQFIPETPVTLWVLFYVHEGKESERDCWFVLNMVVSSGVLKGIIKGYPLVI